jgi:alkylated DNA repair protein (DNA oxidative demethylase)
MTAPREQACAFRYLSGRLSSDEQAKLLTDIRQVLATAPFFTPCMPRSGKPFSVRMSNCGPLGWVSDKERGYRYQPNHPVTGTPWPPMPPILLELWRDVTKYHAPPEACLINYYDRGTKMGSHVDRDEADKNAPVLSVSLGDSAVFHVGGTTRTGPKQRVTLASGDVLVLEGPSRFAYHGIDRVLPGTSLLLPEGGRINLTLRRVTGSS